ncbi:MFS transporter [Amycolatopsis nigrescens]|uniref:MFS transporter n=1 Tax=Amycolatopsis nigrescens TaxID=381445 RepID=UPI00036207BD|nr:MFS transporter [Amycolatopsis nigrescens]
MTRTESSTTNLPRPQGKPGAAQTGVRVGLLIGPMVFGVSAGGLALPNAAAALHIDPSATAWLLAAYALTQGTGTALFGRLSDAKGVHRTLATGVVLLLAGVLACVLAPSLGVLIAGRLVLGAGAGAMTAAGLFLGATSPDEDRGVVLATMAATMSAFVGSGTIVGGLVTSALSWRVTLVLPALSLIGVLLCLRLAASRAGRSGKPVDAVGAGLLVVTAAGILVLIQAKTLQLPAVVVGVTAVVTVLTAAGLALRVRSRPAGFLPRDLVAVPVFRAAAAIGFGAFGGLYAILFAAPQILVRGHGWTVLVAGLTLLPPAVLGAALSRMAGRMAARTGSYPLLTVVGALFAVALAAAALTGGSVAATIVAVTVGLAAFGISQALLIAQVSTAAPPALRGAATGMLQLAHVIGGAIGSAVIGALSLSFGVSDALLPIALLPLAGAVIAALAGRHRG